MQLLLALLLVHDISLPAIAAPAGGMVGFAALDLASGRSIEMRENEQFPLQSVFKLPVAIEVLRQVDIRKLDLAREIALGRRDSRDGNAFIMKVPARRTISQLLEAMLVTSDNVACDKLLSLIGGPAIVEARMRALGVDAIRVRSSESDLARGKADNTATPAAVVGLLAKVARRETGLSVESGQLLEDLLLAVKTGLNRIQGALPPGTRVAHKTGMSGTKGGKTDATNDVGLAKLPNGNRIAVVVFVHASPADEETRDRVIARLARAAYDTFSAATGPTPPR
jgi:beta-lactamase class A